ncbi:MAG: DNA-processing protein DprA [Candidatus Limnocylindria bacterium]
MGGSAVSVGLSGPLSVPWPRPEGARGRAGAGWGALDLGRIDAQRERPYWLALANVPGIGPVSFARLLHRFGGAEAAWRAGMALLEVVERAPAEAGAAIAAIEVEGVVRFAGRLERDLDRVGAFAVAAYDARYPAALADLDPRPAVLYLRGSTAVLDPLCVAVVGTRRPTGYGLTIAREIADELSRAGASIVSGLAVGIDGEAHAACLDAAGRTVAVLPCPIDRVYPPRHRALADRILESGGLLVSELAPDRAVGKPDFARRNRIIAGLARATIVVEAPDGSGALLTAAAALQCGRDVYAVPGPIDAVTSRGCNRLIADQSAALVTSAVALSHQLGATPGGKPISVASLSEPEAIVLAALFRRSGSIEELIDRTRLRTSLVAAALTMLEARRLVTSYGGATFHVTLDARRLERNGRV